MSHSDFSVYIGPVACVVPPTHIDQPAAAELLRRHFDGQFSLRSRGWMRAAFGHPSIRKRHLAVAEPAEILSETPDQRIQRFTEQSVELSAHALTRALETSGHAPDALDALVVNTCTGYICPGIATYLIERMGLPRTLPVYDLAGSGCAGAIPNLQLCEALVGKTGGLVASVAVEICSAAFQMDDDQSLIISNALFADGAAAAVLGPHPTGFRLVDSAVRYVPEQREAIRFVHKQGQLHNQLSMALSEMVASAAAAVIAKLLDANGLSVEDIAHWALHTGGHKIINAVRDQLRISERKIAATRQVLADYGNMSSPTVWFVLDRIQTEATPGEWCIMLAYGAGLSAQACLLQKI